MPSGNKPLHEPMLTRLYQPSVYIDKLRHWATLSYKYVDWTMLRHMASLDHSELNDVDWTMLQCVNWPWMPFLLKFEALKPEIWFRNWISAILDANNHKMYSTMSIHCDHWRHMVTKIWVNIGSGYYSLLPETKLLFESMLTRNYWHPQYCDFT